MPDKTEENKIREAFESGQTIKDLNKCGSFGNEYEFTDVAKGFYCGYKAGVSSQQDKIEELEKEAIELKDMSCKYMCENAELKVELSEKNKQIEAMKCKNCSKGANNE